MSTAVRKLIQNIKLFCASAGLSCFAGLSYLGLASSAEKPAEPEWTNRCKALAAADFSWIVDASTQIIGAVAMPGAPEVPAYCEAHGYVAPQVGFKILLPAVGWNGKFLQLGCGGDCGSLDSSRCHAALRKGYACAVFDAGHSGSGGQWAMNNLQAQVDFGYRGAHVAAVAGKAITSYHYSAAPRHSYFAGCSTGGRQALVLAQRFPADFDGIISGAPWINDSDSAMYYVWANRVLSDQHGRSILSRADLDLVHRGALAQCEMDDGVRDGVIGNPATCRFDPQRLLCKRGKAAGCLTPEQADAVRKIYDGPVNSKGERLYVGGAARGSELAWNYFGGSEQWALMYFRYMVMPPRGSSWQLADFDFDRDPARFAAGAQESLLHAGNPDLRKFKAAGGKLLIYQGWNDTDVLPAMTIDYYETVERTMGGRAATREFARLFMVPGMNHCGWGDGPFAVDYLAALEQWVELGQPPEKLIGAHVKDLPLEDAGGLPPLPSGKTATFTRPIYRYPHWAKYRGSGDPDEAASFEPVDGDAVDTQPHQ